MKVTRMSRRVLRTTTLVESHEWAPNQGAGNPTIYPEPVHVSLGEDTDGRRVELQLTVKEARAMAQALTRAADKVEEMAKKG